MNVQHLYVYIRMSVSIDNICISSLDPLSTVEQLRVKIYVRVRMDMCECVSRQYFICAYMYVCVCVSVHWCVDLCECVRVRKCIVRVCVRV